VANVVDRGAHVFVEVCWQAIVRDIPRAKTAKDATKQKRFSFCVSLRPLREAGFYRSTFTGLAANHTPRTLWPMVKKLLHTRMRVNDLERTVKFYQDALGLAVARRHTSPRGAQLAFLATPNSDEEIEICQLPNSPSVQVQPDLMHLAFEVDDLEKFAVELKKKGYALSDGPTKTGSGSVIAFIDAPEGYEVELIQRAQ
jgi:lactoylglutathione lyase